MMFVSQPTISYQVKSLETELGVKLFTRDTHSVKLTPAGMSFYDSMVRIYPQIIQAAGDVREIDSHSSHSLNLGLHAAYCAYACSIVGRFNEAYPDIRTSFTALDLAPSLQALKRGEVDIQFMFSDELDVPEEYNFTLLSVNRLCVCMRDIDKLAMRESLTLEDLKGRQVFIPVQIALSSAISSLRREAVEMGLPITFIVNKDFAKGFLSLRSGESVTLFSMNAETLPIPGLATIPLEPEFYLRYGVARLRSNTVSTASTFVEFLTNGVTSA